MVQQEGDRSGLWRLHVEFHRLSPSSTERDPSEIWIFKDVKPFGSLILQMRLARGVGHGSRDLLTGWLLDQDHTTSYCTLCSTPYFCW